MPTATETRPRSRDARLTDALEDIFLHVRTCSRAVSEAGTVAPLLRQNDDGHAVAVTLSQGGVLAVLDQAVAHENATSDTLARLALAALDRAREITLNGTLIVEDLHALPPEEVDELCRPIFEASDMLDDFMPADERFPNRHDLEDEPA